MSGEDPHQPTASTDTTDEVREVEPGVGTGIVNPFALADVVAGKQLDWEHMKHPEATLEELLETPLPELFDPKYGSPLYPGLELNADNVLEPVDPSKVTLTDFDEGVETPVGEIDTLEDLQKFIETYKDKGLQLREALRFMPRNLRVDLDLGDLVPRRISNLRWPKHLAEISLPDYRLEEGVKDWVFRIIQWRDTGQFFNEAANYSDPVQGAVGNCYYIAALSSVAWTRPFLISHKTRPTGSAQQDFTCQISFNTRNLFSTATEPVEVTEQIPVWVGSGDPVYARSSEPGEIWPAVYEKAYAKWLTKNSTDHPSILATAGGWPDLAVSQLTGERSRTTWATRNRSAAELYSFVRANSVGGKTVHPMVAWTYPSEDHAPDEITYSNETVAASHAYSVLGWVYRNRRRYIVLRNPWGVTSCSAPSATLQGQWVVRHVDWWKPITLGAAGVFAVRDTFFKRHFTAIGVVKR